MPSLKENTKPCSHLLRMWCHRTAGCGVPRSRPYTDFAHVIRQAAVPVLQICHHIRLLVRCICDCLGKPAPVHQNLLINTHNESFHHRFFVSQAAVIYLLVGQFFPGKWYCQRAFVLKQFTAVEKALHGWSREILFFSFRDCLLEVPP